MRKMLALSAVTLALAAFAAAPVWACGAHTTHTAQGDGLTTTQTAEHPQTPKPAPTSQ